jgi:hypothetical protein
MSGTTYSTVSSLSFSAEIKQDELMLKEVLDYYGRLSDRTGSEAIPEPDWRNVKESAGEDFSEIMLVIEPPLTQDEISRASGCLGYALREVLAGEDLSDPQVGASHSRVKLTFYYDSTKSRRDDPDHFAAFEKAARYISEGTPVRTTNRAGAGTKGTRLVEGIGPRQIDIFVR